MENKEMNMIIKITGILGIIFCLLALVTPWGGSGFTFGIFAEGYSTPFYIDLFTNQIFHAILGAGQVIFFAVAMIIIFILIIIALILGITRIRNISATPPGRYLTIGILMIVTIILYIIALSILSRGLATFGDYGIGFIMAILSAIMFFVVYGLQKVFMPAVAPEMAQQPTYQQPAYTPTQPVYQAPPQQAPSPAQTTPPPQPQPQTAPKFCPQCGSPLGPNAKFCPGCGSKI